MKIEKGEKFKYKHNIVENILGEFVYKENEKVEAVDGEIKESLAGRDFILVSNGTKKGRVWLENLTPIEGENKFEVGEEVKWESFEGNKYKAKIFGISDEKDDYRTNYAITTYTGEKKINRIVREDSIFKLKKKSELERGDKFVTDMGDKIEVIAKSEDNSNSGIIYFGKRLCDGFVTTWHDGEIEEVIQ